MTEKEFCYWLQGLFELGGAQIKQLDEAQTKMIKDHLGYVFDHVAKQNNPQVPLLPPIHHEYQPFPRRPSIAIC